MQRARLPAGKTSLERGTRTVGPDVEKATMTPAPSRSQARASRAAIGPQPDAVAREGKSPSGASGSEPAPPRPPRSTRARVRCHEGLGRDRISYTNTARPRLLLASRGDCDPVKGCGKAVPSASPTLITSRRVSVGTAVSEPTAQAGARRRGTSSLLAPATIAVAALTVLAAALRFYRLGHQGFWFDEANTALLVHLSPGKMLGLIPQSESTPPLYYCLAWVWARIFGYGEVGLRSLSAVAGVLRRSGGLRRRTPAWSPSARGRDRRRAGRVQPAARLVLAGGALLPAAGPAQRSVAVHLRAPAEPRRTARRCRLGRRLGAGPGHSLLRDPDRGPRGGRGCCSCTAAGAPSRSPSRSSRYVGSP